MRRTLSGEELARNGWSSVRVRYNAFIEQWFDEKDIDPDSVCRFIASEVDGYELVETGEGQSFDYALEERVDLAEYHNDD